jgi:hypothetical protein
LIRFAMLAIASLTGLVPLHVLAHPDHHQPTQQGQRHGESGDHQHHHHEH